MTLRVHPDEIIFADPNGVLAAHPAWKRVRLGHVANVLNGFPFPSAGFGATGEMPLIRIRNVGQPGTDTWYTGPYDERYVVEPGSLIIGMDGDFRVARWNGPRALLNQRVCKLSIADDSFYSEAFLRWVLPGYLDAIHRETSSVTVKHLSSETIKELPVPLPPRSEQDRIVAAVEEQFSRLDFGVAVLNRVLRGIDRMRAASSLRIHAKAVRASVSRPLKEVCDFIVDGDHNPPKRSYDGIPYLTAKHVKRGQISTQGASFVSQRDFESLRLRYDPQEGDVLVTCVGTLGEVAVVPRGLVFAADRNLAAMRPSSEILPVFLEAMLRSPRVEKILKRGSGSTAQPHLYLRDLRQLEIPVPEIATQESLVTALNEELAVADQLEADVRAALGRAQPLRSSILALAFSGKLAMHDTSEEPASALLQRIASETASANGHTLKRGRKLRALREGVTA